MNKIKIRTVEEDSFTYNVYFMKFVDIAEQNYYFEKMASPAVLGQIQTM